jgi:predicted dehydrogenase
VRARCLVIGAGKMGIAHLQSLQELIPGGFSAFAPSDRNRSAVERTGATFLSGSLNEALRAFQPTHVIVASPVETLAEIARQAILFGVRDVLVEKPAVLAVATGRMLEDVATKAGARIWVGYNRRFYSSVLTAREMIESSGEPITSVWFEFTEMVDSCDGPVKQSPQIKKLWLIANSTHVIDSALHPVGLPDVDRSLMIAHGGFAWHNSGSVFVGAGVTRRGVPFSYTANWDAPGRWGFEWMTASTRYIFRPLERLYVMKRGSMAIEEVLTDDELDRLYKPGVYRQNQQFLAGNPDGRLVPLLESLDLVSLGQRMGRYAQC